MRVNRKLLEITGLVLAVAILASACSYYIGFRNGTEQTKNIVIENVSNLENPDDVGVNFGVFWEAWKELKEKHINSAEINDQDLLYGAIKGITEAIGDQHTVFFPPEESKEFTDNISGSFSGIGAEIGVRNEQLMVVAPLKDTPAEKAGLQPGDKIVKIDGKSTAGLTVDEAVRLIRGDVGTKVTLTIVRGDDDEREVDIIRSDIEIPTVDWEMIDGDIIYLRLSSFSGTTPFAFQQAMIESLLSGGRGMILDLRSNPGGFLDVSVNIAGWFVKRGDVVAIERFASGEEKVFRARGNEALKDFPVVVLIDEGSASASEILAGVLRIDRGVKIVGRQSFGKGTVQELEKLSDGSTLKITVANWLLPDGSLIEGNGLSPDFDIDFTEEDFEAGFDPHIDKAIEILRQEIGK